MIIHTHTAKSKKRKPNAKQRALKASWEDILKKYEPKKKVNTVQTKPSVLVNQSGAYRRTTQHIPSLGTSGKADCSKPVSRSYTGTAIIGIATMHKSNAVPVFSQEDAVEISRMRRG
jgi:hypothetical protein